MGVPTGDGRVDVALVQRAQRGDRDAYEQVARAVAPRLFLVASRILRDRAAAEDAVQDALVDIWQDLGTLRDPERFDGWAYRIVVRACAHHDRRRRRLGVSIVDLSEELATTTDGHAEMEMRDELGRAFDELSQDQRVVVVLRHLAGLPIGEIADILGVPYGTVGSRLHHAMRSMRASLEAAERGTIPGGQPA
jgi:RNA polymerase sigma-70 factor, ECF subfamily